MIVFLHCLSSPITLILNIVLIITLRNRSNTHGCVTFPPNLRRLVRSRAIFPPVRDVKVNFTELEAWKLPWKFWDTITDVLRTDICAARKSLVNVKPVTRPFLHFTRRRHRGRPVEGRKAQLSCCQHSRTFVTNLVEFSKTKGNLVFFANSRGISGESKNCSKPCRVLPNSESAEERNRSSRSRSLPTLRYRSRSFN